MKKATVTITVDPVTGDMEIDSEGFGDDSCMKALADLERVLGERIKLVMKPEARIKAKKHKLKA